MVKKKLKSTKEICRLVLLYGTTNPYLSVICLILICFHNSNCIQTYKDLKYIFSKKKKNIYTIKSMIKHITNIYSP